MLCMRPNLRNLLLAIVIGFVPSIRWQHAFAQGGGGNGPPQHFSIAIPDNTLASDDAGWPDIAHEVASDLKATGRFTLVAPNAAIENRFDAVPQFDRWRGNDAEWLVSGRVRKREHDVLVEFRLWNAVTGKQVLGQQYKLEAEDTPRVTRLIADAIIERLTVEQRRGEGTDGRK
jgi:Tol biopolymer transport system component